MTERQPNSPEKFGCSDWCGYQPYASERISERAADLVSEACFTAMTGDRHDELAAMDHSMIADRSRSDTVMACMNFNS